MFVMTFEKGDNPGEYWYDIFNSEGIFIKRKKLHIMTGGEIFAFAMIKRNRLYCLQEREDGFRDFKVYRMIWE